MVFILQMISNIGHSSYSPDLNTPTIVGVTSSRTPLLWGCPVVNLVISLSIELYSGFSQTHNIGNNANLGIRGFTT